MYSRILFLTIFSSLLILGGAQHSFGIATTEFCKELELEFSTFLKNDTEIICDTLLKEFGAETPDYVAEEIITSITQADFDYVVASFTIKNNTAYMSGVIDSTTPKVLKDLLEGNPKIDTIVMVDVEGSIDDESNIKASYYLHDNKINTHVPQDGVIASGGVDFFLAGNIRTIESGAKLGVHSWADNDGTTGNQLSKDHPNHDMYLQYYKYIGIPKEFYWFTLNAAPAEQIYYMTENEMQKYGVLTDKTSLTNTTISKTTIPPSIFMPYVGSPLKQLRDGVQPENIICARDLQLAYKIFDKSPICIKPSSLEKLVKRGWAYTDYIIPTNMNKTKNTTSTLYVDSKLVDCVGVGPQQCMLTRENLNSKWELFYDGIIGFDYQSGYEYKLSVSVTEIENPPADASSLQYKLIKIEEKSKVDKNTEKTDIIPEESTDDATIINPQYVTYSNTSIIKRDLSELDSEYKQYYSKYIDYKTPNGGSIYIVAQDRVSDEQVLRAQNILDFYLTDVPGTEFGTSKKDVANKMAENSAVLVMPNGADGESDIPEKGLLGQPLYELEFPVEGDTDYINNNFDRRDAGFEEILHLVHDTGIGIDGGYDKGVLPEYQKEIRQATNNALSKKIWGHPEDVQDWIEELRAENSLTQEYLAAVVDSYYGLWGPYDGSAGMWGIYKPQTRENIQQIDPAGTTLIEKFLSPNITYMTRIHSDFNGVFLMYFNPDHQYTYKSQYLLNARLIGTADSGLSGNIHDNILIGNLGNNTIDGGEGTDVVQFSGISSQYTIIKSDNSVTVQDNLNRDGVDTLKEIEILRFMDKDISIFDLE